MLSTYPIAVNQIGTDVPCSVREVKRGRYAEFKTAMVAPWPPSDLSAGCHEETAGDDSRNSLTAFARIPEPMP